jgi:hypothetical protein
MAPCVSNIAASKAGHFPTWAILLICEGCSILVVAGLVVRCFCKYPPRQQLLLQTSSSRGKPMDSMVDWSPMDKRFKPKPLTYGAKTG